MKWICLTALVGLFSSGPLHATVSTKVTSIEDKIKRLEQDSGIDTVPEKTTFNLFGEFLYWKASLDGVAYATTGVGEVTPGGGFIFDKIKTRTAHFKYSPGFQIGIGVGLPHDHWDLGLQWLRFHTKGRDEAHADAVIAPGNKAILDFIGSIESVEDTVNRSPTRAKAECHLNLDILDATLARTFLWSRYFWIHPFVGIRTVWLKNNWDMTFTMPIQTPVPYDQALSDLDVHNRFTAVGLVGGFDSKWNIYKGFGLFSHASASLIYGKSSEATKQEFTLIPATTSEEFEQTLTAHNSTHAVKGVLDIAIGLKWETQFYKTNHFLMWAGYDFFYWPNITQKTINQSVRTRDRADLSFQGLIIGARLEF